jgi:hypothetical protein
MSLPHPTNCLHRDVFEITTELLNPVSTDQRDSERLLRAAI